MPTYGKQNFKDSNVNYLNKDFVALKTSLMNYAKSYFPNTYRDFNETSPGMMLLEMNAYVGDVLSFYVDQQYREMLLPLAEERRNIINLAKIFGHEVTPTIPAYTNLTFTSNVNVSSGDVKKVDYGNASVFAEGLEIISSTNSDIVFSTLEPIDFKITSSSDTNTIGTSDVSGLASTYTLSRTVRAISATQKTISFQINLPEKFKKITIPDTNVIDIISCVDSNGSNWYEVDFLAQDKVPIPTHYTDDVNRDSAYSSMDGSLEANSAVPYSLSYINTSKRFTRETNLDNTTSLVFGNGILKDGALVTDSYIDMEQVGIVIPGQTNDLNQSIDPLLGNEYSTLGETPNQTTLTITYRVGGGINSNVPSGDLTTLPTTPATLINGGAILNTVTNESPAIGGKDEEDTIEIREKAKAFFTTQNRCVTKEDYEARIMNMSSKFGNIAKVYVTRSNTLGLGALGDTITNTISALQTFENSFMPIIGSILSGEGTPGYQDTLEDQITLLSNYYNAYFLPSENSLSNTISYLQNGFNQALQSEQNSELLATINIHILGYNNSKQLVGNPHIGTTDIDNLIKDNLSPVLKQNVRNYLDNFKLLTDLVFISDGYIVNFGVIFDVIAEKFADKQQVKLDCIQKIKDYFKIENMQFNQPIYKSNLEFELMGVNGVRSVGHVTITQKDDYFYDSNDGMEVTTDSSLIDATYSYSKENNVFVDQSNGEGSSGYGFKYDFKTAQSDDKTIILPPNPITPTVFELKNPNQNIQGRVR